MVVKRFVLLCLSLMVAWPSVAETHDETAKTLAREACEYLGPSCAKHQAACVTSGAKDPNICLVLVHFRMRVAEERCGKSRGESCFEENIAYGIRWMHELNIPNIGNPKRREALRACEPVAVYRVQSDSLKKLEVSLGALMGVGGYRYLDDKTYYECLKAHLQ